MDVPDDVDNDDKLPICSVGFDGVVITGVALPTTTKLDDVKNDVTLALVYVPVTVDSILTPLANEKFGAITLPVTVRLPASVPVVLARELLAIIYAAFAIVNICDVLAIV